MRKMKSDQRKAIFAKLHGNGRNDGVQNVFGKDDDETEDGCIIQKEYGTEATFGIPGMAGITFSYKEIKKEINTE
jgi:hypothetical protein